MISLQKFWAVLSKFPGGKWIFSRLLGKMVPYSGTIKATILELRPGYALLQMKDRKYLRNHLRSIHAIALANFGEMTSGLAFNIGLPANAKAIVTQLSIQFLKKARGTLTAECRCPILLNNDPRDIEIETSIFNANHEEVARMKVLWKVSSAA